ncbi:MAG: hypothetical protein H0U74_10005 [Bradymonadaceae bacterium]|nr:hypothetical protein [Lujinxingiaceae bacterium]
MSEFKLDFSNLPEDLTVPSSLIEPEPPPPEPEPTPEPLLGFAGDDQGQTTKKKKTKHSNAGVVVFHHSITIFLLLLLLGVGTWSYLTFNKSSFFTTGAVNARAATYHAHLVEAQLYRISTALEVAYVVQERYPAQLDELVEMGLLLPSDLYYPLGIQGYDYARDQKSYRLRVIDASEPEIEIITD